VTLQGTSGKDMIYATGFNDTLTGSGGADTFVFKPFQGHDTITDFVAGQDRVSVDLAGTGFASIADRLTNHTADVAGNAVITAAEGNTITFQNVTTATLQAHQSDFHLTV